MRFLKRVAAIAVAMTTMFSLNVFSGINNSLIVEAESYSNVMSYGDYLFYSI